MTTMLIHLFTTSDLVNINNIDPIKYTKQNVKPGIEFPPIIILCITIASHAAYAPKFTHR